MYIRNLLYDHDCIILPDFGAFISSYKSASIHPVTHQFNPPSKEVSFNGKLIKGDGVLQNYIASFEKISFEEAGRVCQNMVSKLKAELYNGGRAKIDGIGTLSLSPENKIVFLEDTDQNYLLDSFGLPSFIQKPPVKPKVLITSPEDKARKIETPVRKKPANGWLVAAALCFIIFSAAVNLMIFDKYLPNLALQQAGIASLFKSFDKKQSLVEASDLIYSENFPEVKVKPVPAGPKESMESVMPDLLADITKETINEKADIQEPDPKPEEQKLNTEAPFGYYTIMGSFKFRENAEKLYSQMITNNSNVYLLPEKNNFHRVAIFSGTNKSNAVNVLSEKRSVQKDAWLLNYHSLGQ